MPLSPELDKKIRCRFDELILEANDLIPGMIAFSEKQRRIERERNARSEGIISFSPTNYGYDSEYQAHVVKVLSLIETVLGNSEKGREVVQDIRNRAYNWDWGKTSTLQFIMGTLQGLKDDYENGFLDNLEERIVANISADYMAQVEGLLDESQPNQYGPALAAVSCGIVLEEALRRLCGRQSKPIMTIKENGHRKRLNALIADLKKENVFNAMKADQLRSWAKVRNHAAHGELSEFKRSDVEDMVKGVKNFLADYL